MPNILVVDDSSDSREPLMRLLRLQGHGVCSACDGIEALEAIERHAPDLILLDVMMPHMDGLTFLKHLRRDPGHKDLPVIIVSALTDDQTMKECTELGVRSYLTKARFTFPQLMARVTEALHPPPTMQIGLWPA
jgi:CheY-like chemotaxis protein